MKQALERAAIYFASGTGNSFLVAKWFQEACRARGIEADLAPANLAEVDEAILSSPGQLVALAFPTHGLLPPWSMIRFLFRLPRRPGARVLSLPTRGSFYLGPVLIPGAAGLASFLPGLVLLCRGCRPAGAVSFDMPVNMTCLHPPLSARHAGRVVAAARRKADRYFERFFHHGSLWFTRNNFYELLWALPMLYLMPLFPLLYLLLGRFFMGKTLFADSRCTGCGTCARSCPTGALVMKGERRPRPYWRHNCEFCLRCLNYCPQRAVESGLSWAVLLWWLGTWVALGLPLYIWLAQAVPALALFRNWWVVELFNVAFYYPAFIIAYALFFRLTRLRPLNDLFSYTGPARLLRQYRCPGVSLADLAPSAPAGPGGSTVTAWLQAGRKEDP